MTPLRALAKCFCKGGSSPTETTRKSEKTQHFSLRVLNKLKSERDGRSYALVVNLKTAPTPESEDSWTPNIPSLIPLDLDAKEFTLTTAFSRNSNSSLQAWLPEYVDGEKNRSEEYLFMSFDLGLASVPGNYTLHLAGTHKNYLFQLFDPQDKFLSMDRICLIRDMTLLVGDDYPESSLV